MIPGKRYSTDDVLNILWRRKWLVLLPTVLAGAAMFAYTRTLPNRYRSDTLVMIQPQRVREDLIRTTAQVDLADRIQTITQQIMSRTLLDILA